MTIRSARLSDASALAGLTTQLGYPTLPEEAEARLRDLLGRQDGEALVAEEAGSVIGWIQVAVSHSLATDPYALILGLVVDESHRGRGTGAALVEAAADWAARHGFRTLRVRSNAVRERTHRFYERLGFQRTKSQAVFARPVDR